MIKGPKGAIPTKKGWVSAKGELLKSQRITQEQIDEWNGTSAKPVPAPEPEPVIEEVEEIVEEVVEEEPKVGLMSRLLNK